MPSLAGRSVSQDRVSLSDAKEAFRSSLADYVSDDEAGEPKPKESVKSEVDESSDESFPPATPRRTSGGNGSGAPDDWHNHPAGSADGRPSNPAQVETEDGTKFEVDHGAVAIAAITSCTNTSNPSVMIGAALLAKKAVEKGLQRKPWVKTTLAPGSKVVSDYYERAGLTPYLDKLGFNLVGYGRTTCIGNSGPLIPEVSKAVNDNDLAVVSVLGQPQLRGPDQPRREDELPRVPAAGRGLRARRLDGRRPVQRPAGQDSDGNDVYGGHLALAVGGRGGHRRGDHLGHVTTDYADVFAGDERWQSLPTPEGDTFAWDEDLTYVRKAPYFEGMPQEPTPVEDIEGAWVLLKLGDSVTTDHISPAARSRRTRRRASTSPTTASSSGINSYGSRRGNHEVMIRGTFANIRLRNQLAPGTEGASPVTSPRTGTSRPCSRPRRATAAGTPLVVLAGKEYGPGPRATGPPRAWRSASGP